MMAPSGEPTGLFEQPGGRLFQMERVDSSLDPDILITKDMLKPAVLQHAKENVTEGAPEHKLEISFDTPEGDDILIKKLDPENALGYRTFRSEADYFHKIGAELYQPSAEELGLNDG